MENFTVLSVLICSFVFALRFSAFPVQGIERFFTVTGFYKNALPFLSIIWFLCIGDVKKEYITLRI